LGPNYAVRGWVHLGEGLAAEQNHEGRKLGLIKKDTVA